MNRRSFLMGAAAAMAARMLGRVLKFEEKPEPYEVPELKSYPVTVVNSKHPFETEPWWEKYKGGDA